MGKRRFERVRRASTGELRLVALAVIMALLLYACASPHPSEPIPPVEGEPLISIGEEELGKGDVVCFLDWIVDEHMQFWEIDWNDTIGGVSVNRYFLEAALDMALEAHITGIKAAELGYSLSEEEEEEVEWEIALDIGAKGGTDAFAAKLSDLGLSGERYRFYTYTVKYLREKMINALFGEDGLYALDEGALWQYYLSHYYSASYIFLSGTDDYGTPLVGEAYDMQKEVADALCREAAALSDYSGFFALVEEHGRDYYMSVNPEGMSIPLGMIGDGAFDEALRNLSVSEVSEVVEDSEGFYIILRLPDDRVWFERNIGSVWVSCADAAYTDKIAEWAEEIPMVISDKFWAIDVLELVAVG